MPSIYTKRQMILAVILTAFLVGAIGYASGRRYGNREGLKGGITETGTSAGLDLSQNLVSGNNLLHVSDQPAGNDVKVKSVVLEKSAWVAIHEDRNRAPGNIIGAGRYPGGLTSSTSIELLRPTVSGLYYAMMHIDDGDSEFNYQKDVPVISDGHALMTRFLIGKEEE